MILPSDRHQAVQLIRQAQASGTTLSRACDTLQISARTCRRWRASKTNVDGRTRVRRQLPANQPSDEEREAIISVCNEPAYQSLPPSQIVPLLADEGRYLASESSFYRVLREADQLHHRGKAKARRVRNKPDSYCATAPNQVWSWDITFLASTVVGRFFRLYLVMDIFSRKIVGWEIHNDESSAHAAELIHKSCLAERITQKGLVLHSDNGSPMKGATMLATLQRLGVVPSFSRPSVSNDNPYSESLFGTMKYSPAYPSKPFTSLEQARQWVHGFVTWYNEQHRHSSLRFVTPGQRHRGEDVAILAARKALYEQARQRRPERWSGDTRNWDSIGPVWLNPDTSEESEIVEFEELAAWQFGQVR